MNLKINKQTMSSRQIAELTGKQHKNVIRDIEKLNESYEKISLLKIEPSNYENNRGKIYREFLLSRMQTFDLMTGYNPELRIKVNRRWKELEEQNKAIDFSDSEAVLQLAQNWHSEVLKTKKLEAENLQLKPKAALMDRVLDAEQEIDIGQAAKILQLGYGRNTFFKKLKEKGILFKNRNEPKQIYIEKGYFELKEKFIERSENSFVVLKVLVTQRGLAFLAKLFNIPTIQHKLSVFE